MIMETTQKAFGVLSMRRVRTSWVSLGYIFTPRRGSRVGYGVRAGR